MVISIMYARWCQQGWSSAARVCVYVCVWHEAQFDGDCWLYKEVSGTLNSLLYYAYQKESYCKKVFAIVCFWNGDVCSVVMVRFVDVFNYQNSLRFTVGAFFFSLFKFLLISTQVCDVIPVNRFITLPEFFPNFIIHPCHLTSVLWTYNRHIWSFRHQFLPEIQIFELRT